MRLPVCIVAGAVWLSSPLARAQTAPRAETVLLHVVGPSDAEVLGRSVQAAEWTLVCRAPCNDDVPLDWEYVVQGGGMKSSGTFHLKASADGSVDVHVHPASKGWFIAGVVGMSTSVGVAVSGFVAGAAHSLGCGLSDTACRSQGDSETLVFEVLAVALLVSGTGATLANLSTRVSQGEGSEPKPADEEVWHSARGREVVPFPAGYGGTLVTVRF